MKYSTLISLLLYSSLAYGSNEEYLSFPDFFLIGASSSAYQIEGGWNASDKGEGVWDHQTHTNPESIADGSNGDVACDSYHKYKEDVQLVKQLGMDFYRISISWPRILPTGFANVVSQDGVNYYNNLINEILKHNIIPVVTIYHFDHPQVIEEMGGWTNKKMVDWFADYARVVYREFGDRVKIFATINEPKLMCSNKLKGTTLQSSYLCSSIALKAHARAYHIYDKEFRSQQNGKVGIVLSTSYYFAKHDYDKESGDIALQFDLGMFAHPIFSKEGDWPAVVKNRIAQNSQFEGLPRSRLPIFSKKWIKYIRGSCDFLGINHYTSQLVEPAPKSNSTIYENDDGLIYSIDENWPVSETGWLRIVPEGFSALLLTIKENYNNPLTYIMENGIPDRGTLEDDSRISYLHSYIRAMLIAINKHGCNVHGYAVWSLFDNFEWTSGYREKFGLIHVDFNSPNRTRTMKKSCRWITDVISTRKLPTTEVISTRTEESSCLINDAIKLET